MFCPKCGKRISGDSFFCQWCGSEVKLQDTEAIVERIKMLGEINESYELSVAKYIAAIWRSGDYKKHYDSLEAFGKAKLGMKKSSLYKYKSVGMKFFDADGEPLIPDAYEWGYGKLTVLISLELDDITYLRENKIISPDMPESELRKVISTLQEILRQ